MRKIFKPLLLAAICLFSLTACGDDDNNDNDKKPDTPEQPSDPSEPSTPSDPSEPSETAMFVQGADVSWLTEMEHDGKKFYNRDGNEVECMKLLKHLGFNTIRLRVWVNPADGWCGDADVLTKALRAKELGMPVMVDFHYSDTWADPSNQTVPAEWADHTPAQLKQDVADHTKNVLTLLKQNGVDVKWVQIGNETTSGMLWPVGKAENQNFTGYVALNNAGYDAAKSVYPNAQCIIHLDRGDAAIDLNKPTYNHLTWMFDGLKAGGAKWDVIGLSLYPDDSNWQTSTAQCLKNITTLSERYGKKVMICEIGMPWDSPNAAAVMSTMVEGCRNSTACLGIFYWEPEVYGGWKPAAYESLGWSAYTKGAFDNTGKPTDALYAFK